VEGDSDAVELDDAVRPEWVSEFDADVECEELCEKLLDELVDVEIVGDFDRDLLIVASSEGLSVGD